MQRKVKIGLVISTILLLVFSICISMKVYASKSSIKMVYKLKPNESVVEVAQRFKVSPQDIKIDENYLMFEVK